MTLVIQNVIEQARQTAEFFGEQPQRVNKLLLRLALMEAPEWLRGRPKMTDLPRYTNGCEHPATTVFTKPVQLCDQIRWIVEEMHGPWCLTEKGFAFGDPKEAVFYRLMWS